jgi:hypothetical protein
VNRLGRPNPVVRGLTAFGRFWWEFLVGDTPELFLAVLVVIAVAWGLHRSTAAGAAATIVSVLVFLGVSTWRGRRK